MTQEAIELRTTGGAYPGLEVVQDVNKALSTIATDFAGPDDPAALAGPYMTWADTGNMLLKRRNEAGTAWVVERRLFVTPLYADDAVGRNLLINGSFAVNQRAVTGTVTLAAGTYGHDRWKAGAGGCTYSFSTVENVTTITIAAGSLVQIIEGLNLCSGPHVLSWAGSAPGRIGAGSYGATGRTATVVGGVNLPIEFGIGTISKVQFEPGTIATVFEMRNVSHEEMLARRYYESSYPRGSAPGTVIDSGAEAAFFRLGSGTVTGGQFYIRFKVTKRAVPTFLTYSDVTGAPARIRERGASVDAGVYTDRMSVDAFRVYWDQTASVVLNASCHWTADAEL